MSMPAPLIWPERDLHTITGVDLAPQMPAQVAALGPQLRHLAALGDGLRGLQAVDGSWPNEVEARVIADRSILAMDRIAGSGVLSPEQASLLERRAAALLYPSTDPLIAHDEAALIAPQPLTVLAGPLCTFRAKTRAGLHSVIACTAHQRGDELVASLDASYDGALAWACEQAGTPDATVGQVWPMQVTDLIAAGGEANAFPKHFAYFLPEDEGVGQGPRNKTILFRNAYGLRYEYVTRPLADRVIDPQCYSGLRGGINVRDILVGWMRGHDIAHAVTTPRGGHVGPADVGHEPWYSLQEVIADAYGTAMALSPCWLARIGCTQRDMIDAYLAEALHYLRRGPWNWSDAGAALMELSFLAEHGAITIDQTDGTVRYDPASVVDGVHALCAILERDVVSAPDASSVQAFLDRYGWDRHSALASVVDRVRAVGGVPTSLAYL